MSKNYDNWERLVEAVVRREKDRQFAYTQSSCDSISINSVSSLDLSFNSTARFDDDVESNNYNDVWEKLARAVLHREGEMKVAQTSPLLERIEYSDLQSLHHSDWKTMLLPHQQQLVWSSASFMFYTETRTQSGRNCFLVGSKNIADLSYKHQKLKSTTNSRFSEVLEIYDPKDLDVGCRIKTQMLSPNTIYTAYLVFAFTEKYAGVIPLTAISTLNESEPERMVYFELDNDRSDGWTEVELGDFRVYPREDNEVKVRLTCSIKNMGKGGLVIEGIEFRPSDATYIPSLPIHKGQFLPTYHSYLVKTGKNSLMLGVGALLISWVDNSSCWKWTTRDHSRFPWVVELKYVWWLRIRGKIKTQMLSPKTDYAAFLVFNLADHGCRGLEQANGVVRFVDESSEKEARVLNLVDAVSRADGWKEIEMGRFFVDQGNEREVEAQLLENRCNLKSGLIVEGIEFRPI